MYLGVRRLAASAALSIATVGLSVLAMSPAQASPAPETLVEPLQASTSVQISQVSTEGPAGIRDEFIELHNVQSGTLNISGYTVWACTATGQQTLLATIPAGTILQGTTADPSIERGQYYLLTNVNYSRAVPGDLVYAGDVQRLGGVLLRSMAAVGVPLGARIDSVGFGRFNPCTETAPAPAQAAGFTDQSVIRFSNVDTNVNALDFTLISPSNPRNSSFGQSVPSSTVQISQVATEGPGGIRDEFIELQNAQSTPLDISGYTVWSCTATGQQTLLATIPAGTILETASTGSEAETGRFYLLTNVNYTRAVPGDLVYAGDVQRLGGVMLRGMPTVASPLGARIDSVGFSRNNQCTETAPAAAQAAFADQSVIRFSTVDTNVNALDFTLISPSLPRNSTITAPFPTSLLQSRKVAS